MHHDLGVGERIPLACRARAEQELAHGCRQTHAHRADVGPGELHRVVDRHAGRDRSAWRVHVQPDVLIGVLPVEVQQLRGDLVGDVIIHVCAEEDDPFAEQAVVDLGRGIEGPRRLGGRHDRRLAHGDGG